MTYLNENKNPMRVTDTFEGVPNNEEYDLLVFIGRFQPFHLGHKRVIDVALQKAKRVLVLVGSSNRPRRPRNPWNFAERQLMIQNTYRHVPDSKLAIMPLEDYTYREELWISTVQSIAQCFVDSPKAKIGLIGCSKDHSSYYLKLFPAWGSVNVEFLNPLNATDIRKIIFDESLRVVDRIAKLDDCVPKNVMSFMLSYIENSESYADTLRYHEYCKTYVEKRSTPDGFPVQDITADAVVIQSGHILLVTRKHHPGKGLLALPGGYVNPNERWVDACIRELREETRIKVPEPVLRGSITESRIFDDPNRSERGRIVTQAFKISLQNDEELPKVKGGDDAYKAFWMPLSELSSEIMFEDHWDIIQSMMR